MGRKIIFLIFLFTVTGCAEFELHVKKEAHGLKPAIILIAPFEMRNMNYDPYAAEEFRDSLKFEFFRRGYNCIIVPVEDKTTYTDSQWTAKILSENTGDILIKGFISQRESGFLADREVDTLISFTIFRKDGSIIGEGFYHDGKPAGEVSLRREASADFVTGLIKQLERSE